MIGLADLSPVGLNPWCNTHPRNILCYYFYAPLAYITHFTDSCTFSKFACIEGRGVLLLCKGFRGFPSAVGYFKITNQTLHTLKTASF